MCRRCRPGSSPDRSRKRRRCTALSMLATPTDTHKRHRARCQSVGRSSGSCPPQVVGLIPSEVPEAFGSCRKFRHVSQSAPRSPCAFAVGAPCPRSSNYTPLPVGSLWGCCAFCEPVGTARKSRSACADLCRNCNSSYKKAEFFKGGGVVPASHFIKNAAREASADCRKVARSRILGKKRYFLGVECPPSV